MSRLSRDLDRDLFNARWARGFPARPLPSSFFNPIDAARAVYSSWEPPVEKDQPAKVEDFVPKKAKLPADVSLLDVFLENTYRLPKKLPKSVRRTIERGLTPYRPLARQANRFTLDDEFTQMALLQAEVPLQKLAQRAHLATLPYDKTWIEFSPYARHLAHCAILGSKPLLRAEDFAPWMGMLFERSALRPTAWALTILTTMTDERYGELQGLPAALGYLFDANPENRIRDHKIGHLDPISLHVSTKMQNRFGQEGFLIQVPGQGPESEMERAMRSLAWLSRFSKGPQVHDRLSNGNMAMTYGEIWDQAVKDTNNPGGTELLRHTAIAVPQLYLPFLQTAEGEDQFLWIKDLVRTSVEENGILRFAITVLAMLNDVPISTTPVQPPGSRRLGLNHRPYLDYHRVALKLPKTKPARWVQRLLNHAEKSKHRAHMVREHWRTYLTENGCRALEDHRWIYDHEHGYRLCERCESFGRRINEHQRGDAALGWVQKEYVLQAT